MIRFTPLLLILVWMSNTVVAQGSLKTNSGWAYEIVRPGRGPMLDRNKGIETHNQLIDVNNRVLVSTYAVGIPDYQLISGLSEPFQSACEVMQVGGHYRFYIPMSDFRATLKGGTNLPVSGEHVIWEVELLRILPPMVDIATRVKTIISQQGMDAGYQEFRRLSQSPHSQIYFGEWEVNELGYLFLSKGKANEAIYIFDYNAQRHPESANAHDSLAEAYLKIGNKEKAVKHYRWSLELNPGNTNARKMLGQIE